jgi:type IV secretion system protein VirD4
MLRFLDTPAIAESTRSTSFDPAIMLRGKMTVYLVVPPQHAAALSGLLRSWVSFFLRLAVRGGAREKNRIHFVLDEASALGQMDQITDLLAVGRSFGVRLQLYYQSLGQLKKCWPEGQDQTLLSNTSQVFFGVNDLPTAEYVSSRIGEQTIVVNSGGTSTSRSYQQPEGGGHASTTHSRSRNDNWQQQARKLLKPEEVMQLPERAAIAFTPGVPPILSTLVRHYEEPWLLEPPGWRKRKWQEAGALGNAVMFLTSAVLLAAVLLAAQVQNVSP